MRGETSELPPKMHTQPEIHRRLCELLPAHDDFWARWLTETKQLPRGKRPQ